ncbi:hypothetical protein E2562_014338 [Oryza meyeriana var. granulata]|uniref:Uncharacterized protein n=1 Tax=Oryza meyeriana var. granulata TaxID=110450 RepID=A0A6G1C5J8_9ORYZ|nr:hypothetical protein E2562_014338 [Oryza meyeriana var. granulata]
MLMAAAEESTCSPPPQRKLAATKGAEFIPKESISLMPRYLILLPTAFPHRKPIGENPAKAETTVQDCRLRRRSPATYHSLNGDCSGDAEQRKVQRPARKEEEMGSWEAPRKGRETKK